MPLSTIVAGTLTLVVGLTVTHVLEGDYYLLAGMLSFSVRSRSAQAHAHARDEPC